MAKPPLSKDNKRSAKTDKKPLKRGKKPPVRATGKNSATRKVKDAAPAPGPTIDTNPPCGACAACDGIATGLMGIPWRDASGTWQCVTWDENTAVKRVSVDGNGVYLANE